MARRILLTVLFAVGLSFVIAFEVGPVAAQDDRDPTTDATAPIESTTTSTTAPASTTTTTIPTGPSTTTTPAEGEWLGYGPDGDVIDPSPWDELRPLLLVGTAVVLSAGIGTLIIVRHRRRAGQRA
jgi:hypothetical protein